MRDQIIHNQREAQRNLWNLLMGLGLEKKILMDIAAKNGIIIEDWTMMPQLGISDKKQSLVSACGRCAPTGHNQCTDHSFSRSCTFQNYQEFGSRSFSRSPLDTGNTFCREEHHNSHYMLSHDQSPPPHLRLRKSTDCWIGVRSESWLGVPIKHPQYLRTSCPELRTWGFPFSEGFPSTSFSSGTRETKQQFATSIWES